MSLDALLCSIPSTWYGERGYTAPQAPAPIEDELLERVPDPVPPRSMGPDDRRAVSCESKQAVAGELWPAPRTSGEIFRSLKAAGHPVSHRQVVAALGQLEAQGKAKRSVCTERTRHARWLWRMR